MAARTTATSAELGRIAGAVLALAGVGLAFEVTLTRLFSLIFQYHYVFLVVSLAVLGLGLGAALGYVARPLPQADRTGLVRLTLALAVIFPLTAWLLAHLRSANLTVGAALVAMFPFLLLGWINSLIYIRYAAHSSVIYGADLIGAAAGLVGAVGLVTALGPFGATLALGAVVGIAALLLAGSWRARGLIAGMMLVIAVFALINRSERLIAYSPQDLADAPRDKTLVQVLNDPSADAEIIDTEWGLFAQVDVVSINNPDERLVFTDAGAGSFMMRYDPAQGFDHLDWVRREPTYLPFEFAPLDNVLIIGAGAGYDVLQARMAGAQTVTAVEIDQAMVEVTREQASYNGGILDLPGVKTVIADGRNFADRSDERYGLIYLNIVYSQAATLNVAALAEANVFTTEALRAYWNRLADDGRIAFVTHNGLEGVRLLMTALRALQDEGYTLPDALAHTALVMTQNPTDPTVSPAVLLVSRQPWGVDDSAALAQAAAERSMQPLFIPHQSEQALEMLVDGSMTLDAYLADNTDYNIFPTTDNRPFFYHLDPGLPKPLRDLLTISALLTAGYFVVAGLLQPRKPTHEWTRVDLTLCFALLGAGFMLVEVPAIQQFKLLFGNPVLSLIVALGALLLGGGLGSLFSARFASQHRARLIPWAAALIGLGALAASVLYPELIRAALPAPLAVRVSVALLALLPLGVLMGVPFPHSLYLANRADPNGIPLFWGMNATASTLGATLATSVALVAGFRAAFWLGAALYLAVAGLVWLTWRRVLAL